MWLTLLVINAIIGLALFEFAWASTKRHRNQDEARDSRFPAWRRNDVKNWSKLKLYPAALTIMPAKLLGFVLSNVMIALCNKAILFGLDLDQPIPVHRRNLTKIVFYLGACGLSISSWTLPRRTVVDKDYSYWLGSDYKKVTQRPATYRVPTFVSNHGSGSDVFVMIVTLLADVSFLASIHVKTIPFVGHGVLAAEGLFCPRGGTPEAREQTVKLIEDRQREVHEGRSTKSPLVIFPEGSTSNGTCILPFKRGAFSSLLPVKPLSVNYKCPTVHSANEVIPDHIILIL
jgi:lysophosphatidylcholine acyltransferase/lyso-PAF acetyltransferase